MKHYLPAHIADIPPSRKSIALRTKRYIVHSHHIIISVNDFFKCVI